MGNWFVSSPAGLVGDGRINEILPPRGISKKACHLTGDNRAGAADLWAQLNHPYNSPVDLSAYSGIAFWARLDSRSGQLLVAINDQNGNSFFDAESSLAPWPTRNLVVSEWEQFILPFDDFSNGGSSRNGSPVNTSAIVSIDFIVGRDGESFDLWIDDLALVCRGACP